MEAIIKSIGKPRQILEYQSWSNISIWKKKKDLAFSSESPLHLSEKILPQTASLKICNSCESLQEKKVNFA